MSWAGFGQVIGQWALESPYLTFILLLIILHGLKSTAIRVFGKRPIEKNFSVSIPEAIAYLREKGDLSQDEAESSLLCQLREDAHERERRRAAEPEPKRRTAWERMTGD